MKQPLFVEVYGEPEVGKSHFCFSGVELGYNPFMIDTTPKAEGMAIAKKFFDEKFEEHYQRARSLDDVRKLIEYALNNGYDIISVDTSANLQDFAVSSWKKEHSGRDRPFPVEYGDIRDKVDDVVILKVIPPPESKEPYKSHLIFTSQMKDEHKTVKTPEGKPIVDKYGFPVSYKTDRRVRDGFDIERMRFSGDIRLKLELVYEKDKEGKNIIVRKATVVKNRFCSRTAKGWISELVGDEEVSWKGVIKLATIPKELGGVGLKEEDLR